MADHGPFETKDQVRAVTRRAFEEAHEGRGDLRAAGYAMLNAACAASDVRTGDWDRTIMDWLSGIEIGMCAVFAALIRRAHEAGKASASEGAVTEWALSYTHRPNVPGVAARRVVQPYPDEAEAIGAVTDLARIAPEDEPRLMRRDIGPWKQANPEVIEMEEGN